MSSIQQLLKNATELLAPVSESAALDAEILLCTALNKQRVYLRTWPDREISEEAYNSFKNLLKARQQGQPIAYLTGSREFWSRDFVLSTDVLIPRPDTELLIKLSLKRIQANQPCKIMDLGTGSGIIAITLAAERPSALISACDSSAAALQIAKINAKKHKVERIQFYQSHWFDAIPPGKFDLIVSNPPYLAEDDIHLTTGDLRFEPPCALISADNGLRDIQHIVESSRFRLENGGFLFIEHGYNQATDVQTIFRLHGFYSILTHHDLAGHPRVTSGLLIVKT